GGALDGHLRRGAGRHSDVARCRGRPGRPGAAPRTAGRAPRGDARRRRPGHSGRSAQRLGISVLDGPVRDVNNPRIAAVNVSTPTGAAVHAGIVDATEWRPREPAVPLDPERPSAVDGGVVWIDVQSEATGPPPPPPPGRTGA